MITIIIICYNVFVKRNLKKIEKIFLYKNSAREETARRGFLRERTLWQKTGYYFLTKILRILRTITGGFIQQIFINDTS